MKRILLPIVRGDRAAVSFVVLAPILVTAMALALVPPAFAQSSPDSSVPSDTGYAVPPAPADPPADAPIDGVEPLAAAANGSASDDPAAEHSGWVRSGDEDSDNGNSPSKVLEVPQVVDPASAQPSAGAGQAARDGDSSSPDQVGSIDDYQDEDDTGIAGVYIAPLPRGSLNPYGVGSFRQAPVNPAFLPGYVPINPTGGMIARPRTNGMNAAIGPTSPMLPGPRSSMPIPGGWWNRAH